MENHHYLLQELYLPLVGSYNDDITAISLNYWYSSQYSMTKVKNAMGVTPGLGRTEKIRKRIVDNSLLLSK